MKGELKSWLRDILLDRETSARGYFRKSAIEKLLIESTDSGRNSKELFSLAVLELWHRQFLGKESQTSHPPSLDPSEDLVTRG
jgi:asparagine synthase (glutamine-hydrolysing)